MNDLTKKGRLSIILLIIIILISITIVGLTAAILVVVNSEKNKNDIISTTTTSPSILMKNLSDTINSTQLMFHLEHLQVIADNNNKTRATGTSGFQATIDYIERELRSNTNFDIFKQEFFIPTRVTSNPILTSTINGADKNYTYQIDFHRINPLGAPDLHITSNRITVIPNSGCNDTDWQNATPYPANNSVVLVMYGQICSVRSQSNLATEYDVTGFLVYDNNISATSLPDVLASIYTYPAVIITYQLGTQLIEATQNHSSTNISIEMFIPAGNSILVNIPTENLCADAPTGNNSEIILIGSHSDSTENVSGINDNGSGAMATLVLALNIAHLLQTSSYEKYLYRIRFCWFAAEERNLLGSHHHVEEANTTTIEGRRLKDYLLMLNFDMLASTNYIFGILEDSGLPQQVSSTVKSGSQKIAQVFRKWFDEQKLPWDNRSLGILSDHVPFLLSGVPCGGTFSGADCTKTLEQRNRYDRMLGHGYGGIVGAPYDPCYHKVCDTIENANPFVYETMTKSAAYVLETFARMPNLYSWLYAESTAAKNQ